jgi:hypothetical protein
MIHVLISSNLPDSLSDFFDYTFRYTKDRFRLLKLAQSRNLRPQQLLPNFQH